MDYLIVTFVMCIVLGIGYAIGRRQRPSDAPAGQADTPDVAPRGGGGRPPVKR